MKENFEVAWYLAEYADYLERQGVEYKPQAYRRGAKSVRDHSDPVSKMAIEGAAKELQSIEGIGEVLSREIAEKLFYS